MTVKFIISVVIFLVSQNVFAKWSYRTSRDEMRGTINTYAHVDSTNRVLLNFPYQGGTRTRLLLRKRADEELAVMIRIDRGQLPCYDDCIITSKFDDDTVVDWTGSGSESGGNHVIFIDDANKFLMRLRSAKRLMIEVNIFNRGPTQFSFDTQDLKWD